MQQKRRGGDQGIFVSGDGELRHRPGKLTVAIVGHSVLNNVCKLAIRDPSLTEDLDLSQLRILWLVNWGKLRKFVVSELQSLLLDIIYVQVVGNDLADDVSLRTLIDRHLQQARACIEGVGAKTVIVGSAMHRQSVRGRMSVAEYNERVDSFNRGMKRVLCRGDVPTRGDLDIKRFRYPQIWFWSHSRLRSPCLVDGVHPDTTTTKRLYYSIRLALKNAGKILSGQ